MCHHHTAICECHFGVCHLVNLATERSIKLEEHYHWIPSFASNDEQSQINIVCSLFLCLSKAFSQRS